MLGSPCRRQLPAAGVQALRESNSWVRAAARGRSRSGGCAHFAPCTPGRTTGSRCGAPEGAVPRAGGPSRRSNAGARRPKIGGRATFRSARATFCGAHAAFDGVEGCVKKKPVTTPDPAQNGQKSMNFDCFLEEEKNCMARLRKGGVWSSQSLRQNSSNGHPGEGVGHFKQRYGLARGQSPWMWSRGRLPM